MYLLAVSENEVGQPVARQLEAELIRFAQENWPEICANKAADARGQVDGLNFMHMVVKDDDDAEAAAVVGSNLLLDE